jgi:hypothetical protein
VILSIRQVKIHGGKRWLARVADGTCTRRASDLAGD